MLHKYSLRHLGLLGGLLSQVPTSCSLSVMFCESDSSAFGYMPDNPEIHFLRLKEQAVTMRLLLVPALQPLYACHSCSIALCIKNGGTPDMFTQGIVELIFLSCLFPSFLLQLYSSSALRANLLKGVHHSVLFAAIITRAKHLQLPCFAFICNSYTCER